MPNHQVPLSCYSQLFGLEVTHDQVFSVSLIDALEPATEQTQKRQNFALTCFPFVWTPMIELGKYRREIWNTPDRRIGKKRFLFERQF